MVSNVAVPVGVLAAICVCMFVFICWWFPRKWVKGQQMDLAEYEERQRQREAAAAANPDVDVDVDTPPREDNDLEAQNNPPSGTKPEFKPTYITPVTPM